MESDRRHLPYDCGQCPAHSGVVSKVSVLIWLIGGGASLLVALLLWGINLLTEIKATLPGKADTSDIVFLKQQAVESKTRLDNIERVLTLQQQRS
jgi:hypothetical protein